MPPNVECGSGQPATRNAGKVLRAAVVLGLSVWYLTHVFQVSHGKIRTFGLGDWMDPYFINYLLEHWYRSVVRLSDPSSPPMFFPAAGTLGYSHGLILFAPFYVAVRPFLHPFQAHGLTVFLVIALGSLSLYLLFRRFVRLGFIESTLLAGFFVTSANVVNELTGIWSQRASVFLIPPILLLACHVAQMTDGRLKRLLASASALLFTLLYIQDFYTAHFALLIGLLLLPVVITFSLDRPGTGGPMALLGRVRPYLLPAALGAAIGLLLFGWIYVPAYREHPLFPDSQLRNALAVRDLAGGGTPWEMLRTIAAYESLRPFTLAFLVALLACLPWTRLAWRHRLAALWLACLSIVVLLVPIRLNDFSLWSAGVAHLPGFSVIRDPKRIIYLYELAVVLAVALFLRVLPRGSVLRIGLSAILVVLLATDWNRAVFRVERSISLYNRWVRSPIRIDPTCRSFFIKGASQEYMSRSDHMWSLYALDAMFVALDHALPTLNGYSAWTPTGWDLPNPHESGYEAAVARWIDRHGLQSVCELDIEDRTMRPYRPPANGVP